MIWKVLTQWAERRRK